MLRQRNNRWSLVDQSLLSLFITFSLIEFGNRGSYIADGLFVSVFLGQSAIASVGVVKSISSVTGILSGMLSVGMQAKCSYELGRGDIRSFNRIFSGMVYLSLVMSTICGIIFFVGARPIAVLMGASGRGAELIDGASDYLRGIGIGFPSIVLSVVLSVACQLDSATKRVRRSSLVNFASNCLFDFIAVKFGLGVFGIALATSLGRYVQIGYLMLHFRNRNKILSFTKFNMNFAELCEALTLGSERSLRSLGKVISPLIVNRIVLYFGGTIAMAAFSVEKDLLHFIDIFSTGLADAVALQTTVHYAEMNGEAIHAMGRSAHKVCAIFLGATCVILVLFSRPIARLYISDNAELLNMVTFVAVMKGLYAPMNALVQSRISYLNAMKNVRDMYIMTFLSSVVYTIVSAFVLGLAFGSYGVLASDLMRMVLLMLSVWLYHAIATKKLRPTSWDYLALPDSFDLPPGDVISLDVKDTEDISLVSEQIQLFCNGHGFDKSTARTMALCFEELAVNTVKFGFPKCKKSPGIDLRLIYANNELVMRLRDNCPMFDVEKYIANEIHSHDDKELRIGLKLISSLAKNISYVHSLETNNVIIRHA